MVESPLFAEGPMVVFIWKNEDGWPVESVSSNIERLYGYNPDMYREGDLAFANQIHPDDLKRVFDEVLTASSSNESSFSHKPYRYEDADGTYHWVNDTTTIIRDTDGKITHYVGYLTDITEHIDTLVKLQKAKEEAESANKSKSSFLANMSHEIRTPMNGILGFVDILERGETDELRKEQFKHVKESGKTLLSIINDILDLSKIESGKLTVERHPFIAADLFEHVNALYKTSAESKGIHFSYSMDNNLPKMVVGDIVRIKQVLFNLLHNAVKFTPEDGTIIFEVSYENSKEVLRCSVLDTGKGIAEQNLEKIFNSFEQEDTSTTRKYGGTGLGLSISSQLVEMMGGKLEVESTLEKGSHFFFEIPLKRYEESEAYLDVSVNNGQENKKFSGKVLIVEDNKTNQILLGFLIDDLGLEYDVANDGLEALKMYKNNSYDVILMDENMPNMNGIEATRTIRYIEEHHKMKNTPIVAVTANALSGDEQMFLEAGMNAYLSKPYTDKELRRVLLEFIG